VLTRVTNSDRDWDDADVDDENDGLLALRDRELSAHAAQLDSGVLQRANMLLLLAEWMQTTGEGVHDHIKAKYEEAEKIAPRFERTHYRAACYWDSLLVDIERRYMRAAGSLQVCVCVCCGQSVVVLMRQCTV
jgi:hypothetical protein